MIDMDALLAELDVCPFVENVHNGECLCGLPAINHDELAAGFILRNNPQTAALIERVRVAEAAVARVEAEAEDRSIREKVESGLTYAEATLADEYVPHCPTCGALPGHQRAANSCDGSFICDAVMHRADCFLATPADESGQ